MMRVSRIQLSVLIMILFCLFTVTGCLGKRDWQYPPKSKGSYLNTKASSPIQANVIVLPLEDVRGNGVKEEYWKVAIPLVPFGDTHYQRPEAVENPEAVDVVKFDPPNDFAKAIAAEFDQARIFSSVTFVNDESQQSADLVFRGRLQSTDWNRRLYSYLLGPVGVVFWMLGLPMSETTTALELDLRLTPINDPSKVLWNMAMEFEGKQMDGPYYGLENAVESYPEALQEALDPAVSDLVGLARQDPDRLMPH